MIVGAERHGPSDAEEPVFIVGPSRSGTKLTMRALRQHPELYISAETHYFDDLRPKMQGRHRAPLTPDEQMGCEDYFLSIAAAGYGKRGDPAKSPMSRAALRAEAARLGVGSDAYFAAFCRLQAAQHVRPRWGEKTPRHVFRIDDMLECYPRAKILCLVRDPRSVIASYRDMAIPEGGARVGDGDLDDHQQERKRRSYDLLVMSLLWRSTVNHAVAARERHGFDRVRILRYEGLVSDPASSLAAVCDWLDLPFVQAMVDVDVRNSTYAESGRYRGITLASLDRWRQRLSHEEVATIQFVCRRWMRAFDYDLEDGGVALHHVALSLLRLPYTALRAAFANRGRSGPLLPYMWRRLRGALMSSRADRYPAES